MPYQSDKFSTLTLIALFLLATFTLASGPSERKSSTDADTPPSARKSLTAGQMSTTVFAVLKRMNTAEETATLQSEDGLAIELNVPKKTLAGLKRGDRVNVTIHQYTSITIEKVPDAQLAAIDDRAHTSPH